MYTFQSVNDITPHPLNVGLTLSVNFSNFDSPLTNNCRSRMENKTRVALNMSVRDLFSVLELKNEMLKFSSGRVNEEKISSGPLAGNKNFFYFGLTSRFSYF